MVLIGIALVWLTLHVLDRWRRRESLPIAFEHVAWDATQKLDLTS